jgi:hypothetical protein
LSEFERILKNLYSAIAEVSNSRVIVDSSKDPAYALTLWRTFARDLTVAHLVRDSRAVAFSWGQQKPSLDREGRDSQMPRFGAKAVGLKWTAYNSAMELLKAIDVPYVRVLYDDLINDPSEQMRRVGGLLLQRDLSADLDFLKESRAVIGIQHTLAGNPMRFDSGDLILRHDERWKTWSNPKERRAVTALTWPLLWRYGFIHRRPALDRGA